MKKRMIALVALVAAPLFSFAQTADEVINKHIAALGGADKIAAVKTMELDQTMSVMGMEMTAKNTYVVGKSSRNDVTVMGSQITTVVDGDKGWAVNPMMGSASAQALPAEAVKAAKGQTEPSFFQVATAKTNKYPYELAGREKQYGKDVFAVKVTRPEGVFTYYIDANSYLLLGSKGSVSAQGQQVDLSAAYSDYKAVDGLTLPYTSEITAPGAPGPITAKVTKVTINPTVDPTIFAMPK